MLQCQTCGGDLMKVLTFAVWYMIAGADGSYEMSALLRTYSIKITDDRFI